MAKKVMISIESFGKKNLTLNTLKTIIQYIKRIRINPIFSLFIVKSLINPFFLIYKGFLGLDRKGLIIGYKLKPYKFNTFF